MDVRPVRIGMAGCGTVGAAAARLLRERRDAVARRTGLDLRLTHVVVRDADKPRDADLDPGLLSSDPAVLTGNDVDVVVEVVGGCDYAKEVLLSAIRAGKNVVTANKALIALYGHEVFNAARSAGVAVGIEASCCGGVPVVSAIERGLVANRIDALYGIVNGTCNFILTEMRRRNRMYEDAVQDAQQLGYAEADPSLDVDGTDSAHKLAIMASLAFNQRIELDRIEVEGIRRVYLTDLIAGYEHGYTCKLLAIARRTEDGITLQVGPAFLENTNPLAHVHGPFNAVSLYGHAVGHTLYLGRGAGGGPTASAVLADIVRVARSTGLRPSGLEVEDQRLPYKSPDGQRSRFYVRFMVQDKPGVMADITRTFADHGISLSAISQRDPHDESCQQIVTVVVITHRAAEGRFREALARTAECEGVTKAPVAIRIVEEQAEF